MKTDFRFLIGKCLFAGAISPLTAYDKNGLKIVIHFGKDTPRPDVLVMVVTIMSTNDEFVKNCMFQAAVPKVKMISSDSDRHYFIGSNVLLVLLKVTKMYCL